MGRRHVAADSGSDSDVPNDEFDVAAAEGPTDARAPKRSKWTEAAEIGSVFQRLLARANTGEPGRAADGPERAVAWTLRGRAPDGGAEQQRLARLDRRMLLEKNHVLPFPDTLSYERRLRRVAQRGVVVLFNAISAAQRPAAVPEEAEAVERKRNFLELLRSTAKEMP